VANRPSVRGARLGGSDPSGRFITGLGFQDARRYPARAPLNATGRALVSDHSANLADVAEVDACRGDRRTILTTLDVLVGVDGSMFEFDVVA